ncbi:DUF4260 domain-containing protein [Streptomyces spiramenti]|uniref:DUF4260 domain-containing protein n=1 Tax=Streptomyces spiramenti TaxID=2720606 RepID=A0ABX1ARA5_9ACTN|nr:DUF4260 domain-containing protein [Streptomyces spiramenti]NJP66800.1 DUF4260 domain-containing protein [Streptomyces spiramenti]
MDARNLFETPTTYRLIRLEYALGLAVATVLLLTHLGEVRWAAFAALFVSIDLVGYVPGAIAHRRSPTGEVHRAYHVLYNVMHSLVTQGLVVLAWIWLWGAEWALLAVPIHLFGDRALFGNFLKPFALSFEPAAHPAYARLASELAAPAAGLPRPPAATAGPRSPNT